MQEQQPHRRGAADPYRAASRRGGAVGARREGEAGPAVRRDPRNRSAAAVAARTAAGAAGDGQPRDAGVHVPPDREEAQGLRRRRAGGGGAPGTDHHALRDRAGDRGQGQPDRQPRQGPVARAVARVDPRRRDDSRQDDDGPRAAQSAAPGGAAVGDPRLADLQRERVAADAGPRQGHRGPAGRGRPRQDAAPARRRHHGLGEVGRHQRDDPVVALQGRCQSGQADHDRPEDAGACRSTRASAICSRPSSPTCVRPAMRSTGRSARWSGATS